MSGKGKQNQFSSVQLFSHVRLFVTPWTAAHQASLSITNPRSSPKLTSFELVMPSNHLILCRPLLLLPPISPSIRVFANKSALHNRWPKYWSFSFNISPSNEHPGLISFRMDWLDLLAVQGTLKSLSNTTEQSKVERLTNSLVYDGDKWSSHRTSCLCQTTCQVFYILFFTCRCSSSSHFTNGKTSHRTLVKFSQGYSAHRWSNQNTNLNFTVCPYSLAKLPPAEGKMNMRPEVWKSQVMAAILRYRT